jgi:hypothetical protein
LNIGLALTKKQRFQAKSKILESQKALFIELCSINKIASYKSIDFLRFRVNSSLLIRKEKPNLLKKSDRYLYHLLWKWAKKRHNQQSNYWIFTKYWSFKSSKNQWNFNSKETDFKREYYLMNYQFFIQPVITSCFSTLNDQKKFFI